MEKRILIGVGVVILLMVVAVTGASYLKQNKQKSISQQTPLTPTPIPTTPTPKNEVPSGWESYESENLGISLSYPSQAQVNEDSSDQIVSISLWGPTQKEGTEVYDGLVINFEVGSYTQESFDGYVDEKYEEIKNEPVIESITPLEKTTLNEKEGYEFTVTGLGIFNHIYLPKNDNEYLQISTLVSDPTDQGFEEILRQILSTLNF